MSEISNKLNNADFVFEVVMKVRSTEVDRTTRCLTVESMTALLSEARFSFLYSKSILEVNSDYQGFIITGTNIEILHRARVHDKLKFEVGVQNLQAQGGDFIFKVTRVQDSQETLVVAYAVMSFSMYDYRSNKLISLNPVIKEAFQQK